MTVAGRSQVNAGNVNTGDAVRVSKADVLEYIADMILELKDMAAGTDCPLLEGLLDLARLEARTRAKQQVSRRL